MRFRIDGVLHNVYELPQQVSAAVTIGLAALPMPLREVSETLLARITLLLPGSWLMRPTEPADRSNRLPILATVSPSCTW